MKLTEILNTMKFTRKSIWAVLVVAIIATYIVSKSYGFDSAYHIRMSVIWVIVIWVIFFTYTIKTLWVYYHLPKNKSKDKMGVLFIIDTNKNQSDYEILTYKLVNHFNDMSNRISRSCLKPIILSLKNIEVIKDIKDVKEHEKLLKKTNCILVVAMRATDQGKGSSKYELNTTATIEHPKLNNHLQSVLANNFGYVFKDVRVLNIDKNNDLKSLQDMSIQLYYICQYIFALANAYAGYFGYAISLFKDILQDITLKKDAFCNKLRNIIINHICDITSSITHKEYCNYIHGGIYNAQVVNANLIDLGRYSKLIKNHGYIINYHLNKAVYNFIVNQNIAEAESEINLLDRYYPKVNSKCRTWNYSKAFLVACKNDAKEYDSIQMLYKKIVDDVVQDPLNIYYFLNRYLQDNPNNTGVKIALFWLVYYKQDLNKDLIDDNFIEEIIFDLQKFQNESLSNNILACYKEMKDRKI